MSEDTTGTWYYQPHKPGEPDLLANPPYAVGVEYQPACGTGAFLVEAAIEVAE